MVAASNFFPIILLGFVFQQDSQGFGFGKN